MLTLRSLWFVMQQQVMLTHYPVKPFGVHRLHPFYTTLLAQDAPHTAIALAGHIADDIKDIRQYFSVCLVITPLTAAVLPVGRTLMPRLTCAIPRPLATRARALSIFATSRTPRLLSGSQLPSSFYPEGAEAPGPASEQQ